MYTYIMEESGEMIFTQADNSWPSRPPVIEMKGEQGGGGFLALHNLFDNNNEEGVRLEVNKRLNYFSWGPGPEVMVVSKPQIKKGTEVADFGVQRIQFESHTNNEFIFMEFSNWFIGLKNETRGMRFGVQGNITPNEAAPILNRMLTAFRIVLGTGFSLEFPECRIVPTENGFSVQAVKNEATV